MLFPLNFFTFIINFSEEEISMIRLAYTRLTMIVFLVVFSTVVLTFEVRLDST